MKKIIVLSPSEMVLAGYLNALYEAGFDSVGARSEAEFLKTYEWFKPDLVVLGNGVEQAILQFLQDNFSQIPIIEHKKGVKGLADKCL
jgi:DNA-binding response OmpR family regulator